MEEAYESHKDDEWHEQKVQMLDERRTKFKPIAKSEINDFAEKVDLIVGVLTQRRQESRLREMETDFNPKQLESGIYRKVIQDDNHEKVKKEIEQEKMKQMLDRR